MNTNARVEAPTYKSLDVLSRLLLHAREDASDLGSRKADEELKKDLLTLSRNEFDDLVALAHLNHVIVRGMEKFLRLTADAGDAERTSWAKAALTTEQARIDNAVAFLDDVCHTFGDGDHDVCVIKSLDHWPDLGSDLDLYTSADPARVCGLMKRRFDAEIASRSWGDRLACKWNFQIPGLPELIEIHVGRLGQTGEQVAIASSLMKRTRAISVAGRTFRVASKSDRLLISTLQRMYRHFYFRLCDILDSAGLVENDGVDFEDLRAAATRAGIWEGTATYLVIVSDYVKSYRGWGLELPKFVTQAARFGGDAVYYSRGFIRVPIMPQSAKLYGSQLVGALRKRELHNGARLSLLPWLATAAVVGQKITGSDKGIW
ncbi:hypothetical protein DYQ86_12615 [Acidobacteria bacterium AB60]|nr:hypothetical protein DYQ86_12615 [Acidobacteria bacterium AB60]